MQNYVAFFDLDRTILSDTSGKMLGLLAYQHGLFRNRDLLLSLVFAIGYKAGLVDGSIMLKQMIHWLKGKSVLELDDFAKNHFDSAATNTIRKDASQEIQLHKKQNGRTVLLTASVPFLTNAVVDKLKMDDSICTELEIIDGRYSGNPVGAFCYGDEKKHRAIEYCASHNFSIEDAYYYADSMADFPLLNLVGNPVCITPERKLAKEAEKRGWPVYQWK